MPAMKRLSPALCLLVAGLSVVFTGCQSTGGDARATRHDRSLGQTAHFGPDAIGKTTAKDLHMVSNRDVVELLREADASFQRASDAEAQGNSEVSAQEFKKMLALLKEAGLDPTTFYASRKDFADELEREIKARQARSVGGKQQVSPIKIPVPMPPAVLAQIDRIRNDYPNSYQSALDRGQAYMPQIRAKLKAAGLPEELVYIAMIESHFHEKIDSRAGAGGMWQFMPETGRIHGLRQDGFIDARYDWEVATDAAISYFNKLRDHFDGNWPLAIASYNAGEYGIARAVKATGGESDFFKLIATEPASNMIKLETKNYYPKFLAYWIIGTQAERYGFKINPHRPEPTTLVAVRGSYALNDLEEAMGLEEGALAKMNPELVRQVTPPIGENRIQIPAHAREKLALALQTVPQYGDSVRAHQVRKGETLAGIANKYGCSQDALKRENNLKTTKLKAGQSLKLPHAIRAGTAKGGASREPDPMVQVAKDQKAQREQAPVASTYTVKTGDTLGKIAQNQGVSLDKLLADNKLSRKSQIKAGQKIKIVKAGKSAPAVSDNEVQAAAAPPVEAPMADVEHKVAKGETLSTISKKYGCTIAQLEQWNGLEKGETIRIDQKLAVKQAGSAPAKTQTAAAPKAAPEPKKTTVTVAKGDTPSKIAAKNGVPTKQLLAWNNLTEKSTIQIGQKLVIFSESNVRAASSESESEPVRIAKAETSKASAKTTHTVVPGQTPTSIAKRYGVGISELFKWNNWSQGHIIRPGDKVVVEFR